MLRITPHDCIDDALIIRPLSALLFSVLVTHVLDTDFFTNIFRWRWCRVTPSEHLTVCAYLTRLLWTSYGSQLLDSRFSSSLWNEPHIVHSRVDEKFVRWRRKRRRSGGSREGTVAAGIESITRSVVTMMESKHHSVRITIQWRARE
jgi:hypothetical protein